LDGISCFDSTSEEAARFQQACLEVLDRVGYALRIAEERGWLLEIALNRLSWSRVQFCLVLAAGEDRNTELTRAAEALDRAVDGLRQAGEEDPLPFGLLARAALRRFRSDFTGATEDLSEALEIAKRGSMRLHECDAHLEHARLYRDQEDLAAARQHVARARELVEETGYERRRREVEWLERTLGQAEP